MSSVVFQEIRVSLEIGCRLHSVAVSLADDQLLGEFDIDHTKAGFESRALETMAAFLPGIGLP